MANAFLALWDAKPNLDSVKAGKGSSWDQAKRYYSSVFVPEQGSHTQKQRGPRIAPRPFSVSQVLIERLALRELEAPAGLAAAVLLALDGAAVAGEEAFLLQRGPEIRFIVRERLGDAVAHRAGLAGEAAAGDRAD